ncbi:MAG: hypothetical protein IKN87_00420 [Bacilli bacterium]|nr:hypothetical protein [Bacilli bacterium]
MKMFNKVFILIFVMSLFFLPQSVLAEYKATVVGDSPVCELFGGARGKCLYQNANLNSVGGYWYSLDLGDEVTVYENDTVPTNDTYRCSDYYVKVDASPADQPWIVTTGYFCHADLKSDFLTEEMKTEFRNAGFPESYWEKLAVLKTNHPKWTFYAIDTELDFNTAVLNETYGGRNVLRLSMSNNYALLSKGTDSFDYINNKYLEYDDIGGYDPWLLASYDTVAFYMDPRNFLSDMYIMQFQGLKNNNLISDENLYNIITSAYGSTYNQRYANSFIEAGKQSGVDPIYLVALSIEEVGRELTTATSGNYNGHYNFYNIGASDGANPVYRGLDFAAGYDDSTVRPWNTPERAIIGGAKWIYNQFLNVGQDTSYFKKFNVIEYYFEHANPGKSAYYNYTHQYMTNTKAPSSEANTSYSAYFKNNLLDLELNFYIPVFRNMPEKTTLPTQGGWPNNYLKSININGADIAGFNSTAESYNYYLDINNPVINISATSISSLASINGLGTYTIDQNKTINIDCVAQNGDVKTYHINVILTGEKTPIAVDVKTTLNSTDIKNNDTYLSGIEIGTDSATIRQKIINVKADAVVTVYNKNGEVKSSGKMATGDKVNIIIGTENKTFDVVIYGDVNGDGEIFASDYVKIKNHIMDVKKLDGVYAIAADTNHDNNIYASDYVKIKNYIMKGTKITQ